jgi:hypothetical protein
MHCRAFESKSIHLVVIGSDCQGIWKSKYHRTKFMVTHLNIKYDTDNLIVTSPRR